MQLDKKKAGILLGFALVLALVATIAVVSDFGNGAKTTRPHQPRALATAPMECAMNATLPWISPPLPNKTEPVLWNSTESIANATCGFMFENDSPVCCNELQVQALNQSFQHIESLFGNCSACHHNLKTMLCGYTCSPFQASFVTAHNGSGYYAPAARFTNFTLDADYAQRIYNSCATVDLGGPLVRDHFPDWESFFPELFNHPRSSQVITFDYSYQFGFNWTTHNCTNSTNCANSTHCYCKNSTHCANSTESINSTGFSNSTHCANSTGCSNSTKGECFSGNWNATVFGNDMTFDFEEGSDAVALAVETPLCALSIASSWAYGSSNSSLVLTQQACKAPEDHSCGVLCELMLSVELQFNRTNCELYFQDPVGDVRLYLTKKNNTLVEHA